MPGHWEGTFPGATHQVTLKVLSTWDKVKWTFEQKIEEGEKLDFGGCIEGMEELRLDLYLEVMH